MPVITVQITGEKPSAAQKASIIAGMTDVMVQVLGKDPAATFVIIQEVPTDNWGYLGKSVTELQQIEP